MQSALEDALERAHARIAELETDDDREQQERIRDLDKRNAELERQLVEQRALMLRAEEWERRAREAGRERDEALRNLAERTGVDDLRSLVAMLIQTDKFGTSIAKGLRVFSDSLRTKRRQRAEQEAQKAAVKLLFPLACFLFPTLFIAILGPAFLNLIDIFSTMN